ncbi:MAG TPA: hypothetical protein VGD25_05565 [Immundisolibacter sp.]
MRDRQDCFFFCSYHEDMFMNLKSLAFGAALGLGIAGTTHAATFTAFDIQAPSTVSFFSPETFSLSYDTTGWASIDSATLFLFLGDNGDSAPEAAGTAAFGNNSVKTFLTTPISSFTGYRLGSVLDQVALGGTSLTGSVFGFGDFLYSGASLVLEYTPAFTPVPELSTPWMLVAGLLAVGGIAAKRRFLDEV